MEVDVAENSKTRRRQGSRDTEGRGSGMWKKGWRERESPVWMKPLPSTFLSSLPICPHLSHKIKRARAPVNGCFYS